MVFTGSVHLIHYADGRYLTGDDIASVVVECAEALARQGDAAATVTIPVRAADGSISHVELLIGPASQIVVEHVDDADAGGEELVDPELEARIRAVITGARSHQVGTRVIEADQDGAVVPGIEDIEGTGGPEGIGG